MAQAEERQASSPAAEELMPATSAQFWRGLRVLTRNRVTLLGGLVLLLLLAVAALAPALAPYDPNKVIVARKLVPPGAENWLGTDQFGRDVLSRLILGSRISLLVGLTSTVLAALVGVVVGSLAGWLGGWVDEAVMRAMDIFMAFPYIVLAIALAAAVGPGLQNVVVIIAVIRVPQFARVARSAVLVVREFEFVEAARSIGERPLWILLRHVMPNCIAPMVVLASLSVATAINAEAAMSFLGLGIQPPEASWGTMLADARQYILLAPWMAVFPGGAITVAVLGCNLLGDGLRDVMDPRLKGSM